MNAETAIYNLLSESSEIAALVGDRIYPVVFPELANVPAIVYSQLDEVENDSKDGPISGGWTFQVNIIGASNMESLAISRVVKTALNWKTKSITGGNVRISFADEVSAKFDEQQQYFQIVQEYRARKAN